MRGQPFTYLLRFKPTCQVYYGCRWSKRGDPRKLWIDYFSSSRHIKALIIEYGVDAFEFEVRMLGSANFVRKLEERVHRHFNVAASANWLNATNAGSMCFNPVGRVRSSEERLKTSLALKGRKKSPEHVEKMATARKGKKQKESTVAARSLSNTGKVRNEDQKERMAKSQTGLRMFANLDTKEIRRFRADQKYPWVSWNPRWGVPVQYRQDHPREVFTGKPVAEPKGRKPYQGKPREEWQNGKFERSAETREKIANAHRGRKKSPEHVEKMATKKRGVAQSMNHIVARAKANKGQKRSPEQIARLRLGQNRFANLDTLEIRRFPLDEVPPHPWVKWNSAHGVPKEYRDRYPKQEFKNLLE